MMSDAKFFFVVRAPVLAARGRVAGSVVGLGGHGQFLGDARPRALDAAL